MRDYFLKPEISDVDIGTTAHSQAILLQNAEFFLPRDSSLLTPEGLSYTRRRVTRVTAPTPAESFDLEYQTRDGIKRISDVAEVSFPGGLNLSVKVNSSKYASHHIETKQDILIASPYAVMTRHLNPIYNKMSDKERAIFEMNPSVLYDPWGISVKDGDKSDVEIRRQNLKQILSSGLHSLCTFTVDSEGIPQLTSVGFQPYDLTTDVRLEGFVPGRQAVMHVSKFQYGYDPIRQVKFRLTKPEMVRYIHAPRDDDRGDVIIEKLKPSTFVNKRSSSQNIASLVQALQNNVSVVDGELPVVMTGKQVSLMNISEIGMRSLYDDLGSVLIDRVSNRPPTDRDSSPKLSGDSIRSRKYGPGDLLFTVYTGNRRGFQKSNDNWHLLDEIAEKIVHF